MAETIAPFQLQGVMRNRKNDFAELWAEFEGSIYFEEKMALHDVKFGKIIDLL